MDGNVFGYVVTIFNLLNIKQKEQLINEEDIQLVIHVNFFLQI